MKKPNSRIIGIEGEEVQLKSTENTFDKIIGKKLPNLKKNMLMKIPEAYRKPNRLDQKSPLAT